MSMNFAAREDQEYRLHAFDTSDKIMTAVVEDVQHHFDKYGPQRLDLANWWMVIGEEEGEAIEAANKKDWENAKKEIRQVIACWIRFYVEVEREQAGLSELEKARYVRAQ